LLVPVVENDELIIVELIRQTLRRKLNVELAGLQRLQQVRFRTWRIL